MNYNATQRAALGTVFGSEWITLSDADRDNVAQDFADAVREDGADALEYRRRIGAGNLQAYAEVIRSNYGAAAFWTARGFSRICTGGNCYAWERTVKADGAMPVQILITSAESEMQATQRTDKGHDVGLYLEGEGEHFAFDVFQNATQAWLWIREQLGMPEGG